MMRQLAQYQQLFIDIPWMQKPHVMSYDPKISANPLVEYAQIPADSRYRFLLSNSQYIVDTFIRGPVCKGQLALNVIEDHFWVMFIDPSYDYGLMHPEFYLQQQENLTIPVEEGSDASIWDTLSNEYRERYARYYRAKMDQLDLEYPQGLPLDSIWKGERSSDAPLLTVYRHFDSASVARGVLGELPKTIWVIDYAQFERTYYSLVAGFDVFGNLSHQTNVRRFMDFIRVEGELNFLNYLPRDQRYPLLKSWYIGDDEFNDISYDRVKGSFDTPIQFNTNNPKQEFIEMVVNNHISSDVNITFDIINYFHDNEPFPIMPKTFKTKADYVQAFRSLTAPGTGFIREVNGYNADVLYLRIRNVPDGDKFISIVINRWHDNVSTLFGEKNKLNSAKDTINFFTESIASYPNYFFDVQLSDLPDFFDLIRNYDGTNVYKEKIKKYGINRSDERFWDEYDWFQENFNAAEPIDAGLYDLNRYYHQAF